MGAMPGMNAADSAWSSIGFDWGLGVQYAPVARRCLTASRPRSTARAPRKRPERAAGRSVRCCPDPRSPPSHQYIHGAVSALEWCSGPGLPVVRNRCLAEFALADLARRETRCFFRARLEPAARPISLIARRAERECGARPQVAGGEQCLRQRSCKTLSAASSRRATHV